MGSSACVGVVEGWNRVKVHAAAGRGMPFPGRKAFDRNELTKEGNGLLSREASVVSRIIRIFEARSSPTFLRRDPI
jgi:hypothetical protein